MGNQPVWSTWTDPGYKQKITCSPVPAIALGNLGGLQPFSRFVRGPAKTSGGKGGGKSESKWPKVFAMSNEKRGPVLLFRVYRKDFTTQLYGDYSKTL